MSSKNNLPVTIHALFRLRPACLAGRAAGAPVQQGGQVQLSGASTRGRVQVQAGVAATRVCKSAAREGKTLRRKLRAQTKLKHCAQGWCDLVCVWLCRCKTRPS
jgi:hypothetical protein